MMSCNRFARILSAAALAVLTLVGCGKKPDEPSQPAVLKSVDELEAKTKSSPSSKPIGKPDFTLAAVDLRKEFEANADAANGKYKGKVIEVSGTVDRAERDFDNKQGVVMLKSAEVAPACACNFADRNIAGKVGPEQTLRLKGRFLNSFGTPTLEACEIVEKGPDPLVSISAENLAKEYSADSEACEKRLKKKTLVVSGEFSAVKTYEGGFPYGELKGDGKVIEVVRIGQPWPPEYKAGSKVKFVAELANTERGKCKIALLVPLDVE